MSENKKCLRCGKELTNPKSIELGYGNFCYKIMKLEESKIIEKTDNVILEELVNRIRKLELDNTFMKYQLKNKTFVNTNGNSKDAELEWDIPKEVKEIKAKFEIEFTVVVKELKLILKGDNFDYHSILTPIEPRTTIEPSPLLKEILITN